MVKNTSRVRTVTHYIDPVAEVAGVYIDNVCVMVGQFDEFNPYTRGIHHWGLWNSARALVTAIQKKLTAEGYIVEVIRHENCRFVPPGVPFEVVS